MAKTRVQMESMTWREVESRITDAGSIVFIPIAATEQHGPHLPLSTDTVIGEELACQCARRFDTALVAPVVQVGTSPFHQEFAGSLSIPATCLMTMIRHISLSIERHGAEHIVLLPSHGGNFPSVNALAPELAHELESATLHTLANLERFMELMNRGLHDAGLDDEESVVHAGATETAVMMAIAPSLVHEDELKPGYEGDLSLAGLLENGFGKYTTSGVLGDPTHATATAGETILNTIVDAYVGQLSDEIAESKEI